MKWIAVLALVVTATACSSATVGDLDLEGSGIVHRFVIPLGTGERVDRGETVDVMPDRLEIGVGDVVEIVNNDDRGHNVGLFFVGEGETVRQMFPSVAEFSEACSVSSSGQFTIVVS